MLDVDFKTWSCTLSLFLQMSCQFLNGHMCYVDFKRHPMLCLFFSHGARLHIAYHFKEMAMSKLEVKSPIHFHNVNTLKTLFYYLCQR